MDSKQLVAVETLPWKTRCSMGSTPSPRRVLVNRPGPVPRTSPVNLSKKRSLADNFSRDSRFPSTSEVLYHEHHPHNLGYICLLNGIEPCNLLKSTGCVKIQSSNPACNDTPSLEVCTRSTNGRPVHQNSFCLPDDYRLCA